MADLMEKYTLRMVKKMKMGLVIVMKLKMMKILDLLRRTTSMDWLMKMLPKLAVMRMNWRRRRSTCRDDLEFVECVFGCADDGMEFMYGGMVVEMGFT